MKFAVKLSKSMGRGLFATEDIRSGRLVEKSPVVILDRISAMRVQETELSAYIFHWSNGRAAIGLGYGSLFNHSNMPNVTWWTDEKNNQIVFKALRSIKNGEELFINYSYDPCEWSWKKGAWVKNY